VIEWKVRGETLARRHAADQPDGLRQLSAIFGPERVEQINKIQEQLIKDYAAASNTDAKAQLLSKAANDIAGVQDTNRHMPDRLNKIVNERAAAALMGYRGVADENNRDALQAMGILTHGRNGESFVQVNGI
jgi:hypothetical protein